MENPAPYHADVQMTVLRSLDPQVVIYLFFKITDPALFRPQLQIEGGSFSDLGKEARFKTEGWRIEKEGSDRPNALNSKQAAKAEQSGRASKPLVGRFSNVAFTFAGLTKLGVDPGTLATFPQPFRDGMAARATILGDKGDAAPEKWDGYLGSLQIDGVMWLNFRLSSRCADDILAEYEKRLDQAKAVFPSAWFPPCPAPKMRRDGAEEEGSKPADDAGAPKQIDGVEVLHVEFGMANYVQEGEGKPFRVEHFGYRDGVSQPYANLDLDPPPPGGGTPRDNGSWAPVAPGEILLGHLDEDGRVQHLPANEALRTNGSYMALRKLEQDVVGFRSFLKRHQQESRPPLGPQMVGRWPDGSPLVKFPEGPEQRSGPGRGINDFRYQRDDPFGRRCPIGAHIRRANPRDTNDRDQARRHRLFRRGISYGGPLLPADSIDEECPRGLLFVSMQARLDRQFEFVLTNWLGRGEFEGQAGAKLDPLLGDHRGRLEDAFQPTGAFGPVTGLPRFVTMRGGDYFFVPSVSALAGLSNGDAFPIDDLSNDSLPQDAIGSIQAAQTDNSKQLIAIGKGLLAQGAPGCAPLPTIVTTPFPAGPDIAVNAVVVGRHDYVKQVLEDNATYSTRTLSQRALEITGGQPLLIGMAYDDTERLRRLEFLHAALALLARPPVFEIARGFAKQALDRVTPLGRLDVVNDFGRVVPILCADALFGVHGPDYVSATGVATLFGRVDMTDIPDDWLKTLPPVEDYAKPIVAMQAWTRLSFLQIFVNVVNAGEIVLAAERATREFLRQIDSLIFEAQSQVSATPPGNLLQALVQVQKSAQDPTLGLEIQLILAEFAAGSVETVNAALANLFDYLLDNKETVRLALCQVMSLSTDKSFEELMHILQEPSAEHTNILNRLIFEILRFKPMGPISFRYCEADAMIGDCSVPMGTNVILVPAAAMVDERAFPNPGEIRFDRPLDSYLHFGAGCHTCAGQRIDDPIAYHIALPMLRALFLNLASLPGLRRAAGPEGVLKQTLPTLADSLVMRFEPT
jgi:Dyp-type peroxidase family